MQRNTARILFFTLLTGFLVYTFALYSSTYTNTEQTDAAEGRLVWQRYNCQSCHQLYGLGGYLGPDLTNLYSNPNKGEAYVKAMVRSGTQQMPAFQISDVELQQLNAFLQATNASGVADPRKFSSNWDGMITQP